MRITDRMRYENPRMRILRLTNRQAQTTEELSTGKRLNRPSDDPLSALKATIFESQGRRVQQQKRNIDAARNTLVISESVLGEASTTLLRVKELAIQSLSSVMSGTDRSFMGAEVSQLREHLRSIANTKSNHRYLFAGYQSDQPPYNAAGVFVGDTNFTEVEIGDGLRIEATLAGGRPFGDGTANTVDTFQVLTDLEAAILAADENATQDAFEALESSIEQIITSRQQLGVQLTKLSSAESINEYLQERIPQILSEQRDTDFAEAVSELTLVENSLQATLAASSRMLNSSSLLDFLR